MASFAHIHRRSLACALVFLVLSLACVVASSWMLAAHASESEPAAETGDGFKHDHDHVHFNWSAYTWQSPPIDAMVHEYKADVEVKNVALNYLVSYAEHFLATEPLDEHWGWNAGRAHGPDAFEVVDFTRGRLQYYTFVENTAPLCTTYNVSWIELASLDFATSVALFEAIDGFVPADAWQFTGRSIDTTRGDQPTYRWVIPLVHLYDNSTLCIPGFACHHESLLNLTGFNDGELDHLGHVSLPDSVEMFWGLIDGNLSAAIVSRVEAEVAAGDRSLSTDPAMQRVRYSASFRLELTLALSNETHVWDEETVKAGSIMSMPVRIELIGELFSQQPGSDDASAAFVRNVHSVMDWYQVQPLNLRMHHDLYNNPLLPCYAPGDVAVVDGQAAVVTPKASYRTSDEIRAVYPLQASTLAATPALSKPFPAAVLSPAFQSEVVVVSSEPTVPTTSAFLWYTDGHRVQQTSPGWSASSDAWREAVEFYTSRQVFELFIYNSTSPVANGGVYTLLSSTLTDRIETAVDSCSFAPLADSAAYTQHPALALHDGSVHYVLTGGRFNGANAAYNTYLAAFTYAGRTTIRDLPADTWSANFTRTNPLSNDGTVYTYRQTIYVAPEGYSFLGRDESRREIIRTRTNGALDDAAVLLAVETEGVATAAGSSTGVAYHDAFHFVNYWPNSVPADTLNPNRANYPCPMSPFSDQKIRFASLTAQAVNLTSALLTPRAGAGAAYLPVNASVNTTTAGVLSSPPTALAVFGGYVSTAAVNDVFVSSDAGVSFVPVAVPPSSSGLAVAVSSIYCAKPDGSILFALSPGVFAWSTDAASWSTRSISFNIVQASCVADWDGNVYVTGGRFANTARTTTLVTTDLGVTWRNGAALPAARSRHAFAYGVVNGTEYFVVAGHLSSAGRAIFVSTDRLQSWQTVTPSTAVFDVRAGASLLVSEVGTWVYVGAWTSSSASPLLVSVDQGVTWKACTLDNAIGVDGWSVRTDVAVVLDVNGFLTMVGGQATTSTGAPVQLRDVWRSSFSFDDLIALNTNCVSFTLSGDESTMATKENFSLTGRTVLDPTRAHLVVSLDPLVPRNPRTASCVLSWDGNKGSFFSKQPGWEPEEKRTLWHEEVEAFEAQQKQQQNGSNGNVNVNSTHDDAVASKSSTTRSYEQQRKHFFQYVHPKPSATASLSSPKSSASSSTSTSYSSASNPSTSYATYGSHYHTGVFTPQPNPSALETNAGLSTVFDATSKRTGIGGDRDKRVGLWKSVQSRDYRDPKRKMDEEKQDTPVPEGLTAEEEANRKRQLATSFGLGYGPSHAHYRSYLAGTNTLSPS